MTSLHLKFQYHPKYLDNVQPNKPVIYSAREVGRGLDYTGGLVGLRLASLTDFQGLMRFNILNLTFILCDICSCACDVSSCYILYIICIYVRLCLMKCASAILIFYIHVLAIFEFYICSRTKAAYQLMSFADCNRLKLKLIVLYCIVSYCIVLYCIVLCCVVLCRCEDILLSPC